jgi:hypothetical protein
MGVCFVFWTQVKRQAETRLREHFAEPLRTQAQTTMIEDDEDEDNGVREARRRIPEPL